MQNTGHKSNSGALTTATLITIMVILLFSVPIQDELCHTVTMCRVVLDEIAWKKELSRPSSSNNNNNINNNNNNNDETNGDDDEGHDNDNDNDNDNDMNKNNNNNNKSALLMMVDSIKYMTETNIFKATMIMHPMPTDPIVHSTFESVI